MSKGTPKLLALSEAVRAKLGSADRLVEFYYAIAFDPELEGLSIKDRMQAAEWLSERGYGKVPDVVVTSHSSQDPLLDVPEDQLVAWLKRDERVAPVGDGEPRALSSSSGLLVGTDGSSLEPLTSMPSPGHPEQGVHGAQQEPWLEAHRSFEGHGDASPPLPLPGADQMSAANLEGDGGSTGPKTMISGSGAPIGATDLVGPRARTSPTPELDAARDRQRDQQIALDRRIRELQVERGLRRPFVGRPKRMKPHGSGSQGT